VTPRATVVVHLDGGLERARRCLRSLAALAPVPEHEVIVLDDASAGLGGLLDSLEGDVRVLRSERREGLLAGAARAAEPAAGEVLVLLAGAPELGPGALAPLVAALDDATLAAAAAATGDGPGSPVEAAALALRRADADCLTTTVAAPGAELAALCAVLARRGRVETISAAVARPAGARTTSGRAAPGSPVELTVVVPTLDATSERVRACVGAIQAATAAPHQIVIVDNGAPPQGFTAPVNSGLRAADTPYAVVMNDDVEPLPGWWEPLRAELDGGAAVTFPLTVEGGMRTDFAAWCFAMTRATVAEFGHAEGAFFDPELRVWYQDTDLLLRLRAAGRPPLLVRESEIRHGLSLTVASDDPELRAWIERTVAEDRAAFARKHPGAATGR
jgi:GT2 family glycosyltransferase